MSATTTKRSETPFIITVMIRLINVVFFVELAIDRLVPDLLPTFALAYLDLTDASLLIVGSAPFIWFLVLWPFRRLQPDLELGRLFLLFGKLVLTTFAVELLLLQLLPAGSSLADDLSLQIADAFLVCLGCAPLYALILRRFADANGLRNEVGQVPVPFVIMYKLVLITLVIEFYVMKVLDWLRPAANAPEATIIDAALLGLIVSPFIWLLVVRPVRSSALAERAQFDHIVSQVVDGVIILNSEGRIESCNRAGERIFGVQAAKITGAPIRHFIDLPPVPVPDGPEDEPDPVATPSRAVGFHRDGHRIPLSLSVSATQFAEQEARLLIVRDMSLAQKAEEEQRRLELQLQEARKLESIGQLAGGVAHEVRNPLNAILTITEALFREQVIEGNPEFDPYIQHIREQVNRLAQLMNDLLDLGKPIPVTSLQPVPLLDVCLDTLVLWQSTGMAGNRKWVYDEGEQDEPVPMVLADSLRLQQVLLNLLENAGDHSPQGTAVHLRFAGIDRQEAIHRAIIQIVDAGSGIPAENLGRVFDPFFSNRRGGTGLGLALVRHFIEAMGGSVQIRNNSPLPGCTAEIRIPLADEVPR